MIAFDPLFIVAKHASTPNHVRQTIFEPVARRAWRLDESPRHDLRESIETHDVATIDQLDSPHVGEGTNTSERCQILQHVGRGNSLESSRASPLRLGSAP